MFCTITPTRGDRPELLEFCKHQLSRMSIKPSKSYFIDETRFKPVPGVADIKYRIALGLQLAAWDGFDMAYIIEDDDYYSPFYFSKMTFGQADIIGVESTVYYHIGQKAFSELSHPGRSSLFTTAVRISSLRDFDWDRADPTFLDLDIWRHAKKAKLKTAFKGDYIFPAIGIKHGIGACGGSGHRNKHERKDEDLEFLKRHVDVEAFDFYQSLNKKL